MQTIDIIGYIAGFLGLIAWMPQFQTVWFKRLHQGLDLRTCGFVTAAILLWSVYGYLINSWPVMCSNWISGMMVLSIIFRTRHLRRVEHNTGLDTQKMVESYNGYDLTTEERDQLDLNGTFK
jgi:MtN3 and saliva related transmembrane protein